MAAQTRFKPANQVRSFHESRPWDRRNVRVSKYSNAVSTSVRFQNLGLSGLSTACDPSMSYFRKAFWGCLWLAGLTWCIIEIINSIVTFASSPFSVDVKYEENQTMIAPYVTLCPADFMFRNPAVSPVLLKERYCNTSYKSPLELLSKCNMTIDNLWNISRFEIGNMLYRLFQANRWLEGIPDLNRGEIETKELVTIHGTCLMFKRCKPFSCMGMQNGLNIKAFKRESKEPRIALFYTGIIHSEAEIPFIQYAGTTTKGFYAAYNQLTIMALSVQQLIHVNTWKNPCQPEESHLNCLLQCTESKIIAKSKLIPCRLPYMGKRFDFPQCKTENEFLDMYTATQSALQEVSGENCGCIKPCQKLRYKEDYFLTYPVKHLFGYYVVIPSCDIEVIEDHLIYDFTSFLSSVGGHLGLFLGMSVLSIVELLEVLFWKSVSMGQLFLNIS